jgi:cell division protease FtsH
MQDPRFQEVLNNIRRFFAEPKAAGDGEEGKARWLVYGGLVLLVLFLWSGRPGGAEIPYSEFLKQVDAGNVEAVQVSERYIAGQLKAEKRPFVTVPLWNNELAKSLEQHGVEYQVLHEGSWLGNFLALWLLPMLLLFFFWSWMAGRMTGGRGLFSMGRSRGRIQADTAPKVTFNDVAGAAEAKQELAETIDFLRDPERIQRLGGRMPKGVLLVGAPGTGKTLLARAVAGEAGVSFFNIGGSEFIELFVGVGAARVRDLFEQARKKAPSIIFIDELDAIGRSRGGPVVMGGHDEREQTLNQLLTEMDGFDPSSGVVVMAASNRPEILDKALLRAGRFDRQVVVDKPDLEDRVAILKLHSKAIKLADNMDLRVIAQRTPGFVGADLANIANEAAILAVRNNQECVTLQNFEAAIDRVVAGPEKKSRVLSEKEKRRVAYHEAGHALVAELVPTGEPVHKVSIIPRGVAALGYTLQLPVEEKFLSTEQELKDHIAILMGGRTAEELVLGEVSSGAQNDIEKASEIARSMVCELGMSGALGPLTYGRRQRLQYLPVEGAEERNFSEETATLIDAEVRGLVEEGRRRAFELLTQHRPALDAIAGQLQEHEVLNREEVKRLLGSAAA